MKYQEKGGIRNLGWVATYLESSETLNQEKATNKKGFMTRDAILSLNGFSVGMNLKENRADAVLQDLEEVLQPCLLQVSCLLENGPLASGDLILHLAVDVVVGGEFGGHIFVLRDQKMLEEGSMGQVEIKIENPEKVEAKNQAKVLKSGKDRLEKEIGLLKDCSAMGGSSKK